MFNPATHSHKLRSRRRVPTCRDAGRVSARARAAARALNSGSARARLQRRARATRLGPAQAPGPGPGLNPAHWHAPRPIFGDAVQEPHMPNLQGRDLRMAPTQGLCHLAVSSARSDMTTAKQFASQAVLSDPRAAHIEYLNPRSSTKMQRMRTQKCNERGAIDSKPASARRQPLSRPPSVRPALEVVATASGTR